MQDNTETVHVSLAKVGDKDYVMKSLDSLLPQSDKMKLENSFKAMQFGTTSNIMHYVLILKDNKNNSIGTIVFKDGYVNGLYINENSRKKGYGRLLLSAAAKVSEGTAARLGVQPSLKLQPTKESWPFYQKLGFKVPITKLGDIPTLRATRVMGLKNRSLGENSKEIGEATLDDCKSLIEVFDNNDEVFDGNLKEILKSSATSSILGLMNSNGTVINEKAQEYYRKLYLSTSGNNTNGLSNHYSLHKDTERSDDTNTNIVIKPPKRSSSCNIF